jgi:hypothetical protein
LNQLLEFGGPAQSVGAVGAAHIHYQLSQLSQLCSLSSSAASQSSHSTSATTSKGRHRRLPHNRSDPYSSHRNPSSSSSHPASASHPPSPQKRRPGPSPLPSFLLRLLHPRLPHNEDRGLGQLVPALVPQRVRHLLVIRKLCCSLHLAPPPQLSQQLTG